MNRIILISGNPSSGKTRKILSYKNLIMTFTLRLVDLFFTRFISALVFLFFHSFCVLGKSPLLRFIANRVLELGLNCCISAPTGKLASAYSAEFTDCRVNTVHSRYFIPVGNTNRYNAINWTLADVHVLLVDEV